MSSSQTVESYVAEIVSKIKEPDYPYLGALFDTLKKMRQSSKVKHSDNYWKVVQCLGETGSDVMVKRLVRCQQTSCKCHVNSNLNCLLLIFTEMQTSVAALKHFNLYKEQIVPVLLKAVRQRESSELTLNALINIYRCLLVGKFSMVELLLKHNIFRDVQEQVKSRLEYFSLLSMETVQSCLKILHAMAVLGGTNTQRRIKSSQALKILFEYAKYLKANKSIESNVLLPFCRDQLYVNFNELFSILYEDTEENLKDCWHPKDKLNMELANRNRYYCSCPTCRKPCSDTDKFLYCGACKLARYCSDKCQKEHWKNGHKSTCLKNPIPEKELVPL